MKAICLLVGLLIFQVQGTTLVPQFEIEQRDNYVMAPGERVTMAFSFFNPMLGMKHKMFMPMMGKLMHVMVISRDLSHFAHIHPTWVLADRSFQLKINSETDDFDNQDLHRAVIQPGEHFVISESMPMVMGQESKMVFTKNSVKVSGAPPIRPDYQFPPGDEEQTVYVGEDGGPGDKFRVKFSYELFDFCDKWVPKFYLNLEEKKGDDYEPAVGFKTWLGMGGHGTLISAEDVEIEERSIDHFHALLPIAFPGEFTFPYDDHLPALEKGSYKLWFQVRKGDQVLTLPFTFSYDFPGLPGRNFCLR